MKKLSVIVVLLLLSLNALAELPQKDSAPLTPLEFHEQECARLKNLLAAEVTRPIASTQADYDALYYDLTLDFRGYYSHTIAGAVDILARSTAPDLSELVLDLCSTLIVDSALCEGTPQSHTSSNNLLHVSLDRTYGVGEMVQVRVVYHGTPCQTNVPYTSVQFYDRPVSSYTVPTEATLSEPFGARDWWPSKNVVADKADSVRVSIIVADTLTATSNGMLESVTTLPPSSRKFTWVERHPISTYLICANATNYTEYRDAYVTLAGDTMPIEHYPYPERLSRAQTSWSVLPAMMSFCAGLFGEYPFLDEKYGHTMFSFGGGMEHQTNTSFGRNITPGSHTYDYIVQHELVHQWYGDEVTLATWPNVWLNEGFATYGEALWFEHTGGFAAYRGYMTTTGNLAVTDPSGPVYNPSDLFNANTVYNKGAWVLHMLRGVVRNDSLFFAALREYRARHAYGNATTQEFLSDVSDVAGYDVTPYLYSYLYQTNRPLYTVSFGSAQVDGALRMVVRLRQTQTNPPATFRTRLDLRFSNGNDTLRTRMEDSLYQQRFYVRPSFTPTALTVDPDDWVLKQVTSEPLPLTIMNDTLPSASVNAPYEEHLTALNGSLPLQWSAMDNTLPRGLRLSADGTLRGTPQQQGLFSIVLRVADNHAAVDKIVAVLQVFRELQPPQNLVIYPLATNLMGLCWTAVADADSYRVYRADLSDSGVLQLMMATADTFATDTLVRFDPDSTSRRFYEVHAVRR